MTLLSWCIAQALGQKAASWMASVRQSPYACGSYFMETFMLKIFHAPRTRSLRVVWLCEEMGVPYQLEVEKFGAPSAAVLAVNPLGAFPALVDGDVTMIESIAIMMYIMGKYGPTDLALSPRDPGYAKYLQFLVFGESGMAMYCNPLIATRFRAPEDRRDNWTVDYLRTTVSQRLDFVDKQFGEGPYIAGNRFTAADISIGYTLGITDFAASCKLSPRLQAYHDRLTARPAYQRAMAAA
jgi:glutathione S-transferase